jgi:hypothetical protein
MRTIMRPRSVVHLVAVVALLAVVCGCTPDEPQPKPSPASTSDAPFADEDEALAAAQETYEEFMAVANSIMAEGGASPERLDAIATPSVAAFEKRGFEKLVARDLKVGGTSIVTTAILQSYTPTSTDGRGIVVSYFCVDGSAVTVVDGSGASVVDESVPALTAFQVTFDLLETSPSRLVVSSKEVWVGAGIC